MNIAIKGSTILKIVAWGGLAVTIYLVAKKSPEAQKNKEAALQAKREQLNDPNAQLTLLESAKAQFGTYLPAIVSGAVAVGTMVGSDVINEQTARKVTRTFDEYKKMTDRITTPGTAKLIEGAVDQKVKDEKKGKPWEQKEKFRIKFQGQIIEFESTRVDVIEAIYEANRYFHGRGILTFNEFLHMLGQPPVEEGDDRGWECYIGEATYGYTWIDFGMKDCPDEPWVTEIYMACYPHFFDEDECDHEIEEGLKKLSKWEVEGTAVPRFLEANAQKGIDQNTDFAECG